MKLIIFIRDEETSIQMPKSNIKVEHIQFNSIKLEDLLLIAKFRIINFTTSVIINNKNKVLLKMRGYIPDEYIDNLINE